jgi:hypothetical protein
VILLQNSDTIFKMVRNPIIFSKCNIELSSRHINEGSIIVLGLFTWYKVIFRIDTSETYDDKYWAPFCYYFWFRL